MKKLLALILVLSLVLAFSACGGGKDTTQPTEAPAADGSEPAADDTTKAAETEAPADELKDVEIKDFGYYVENGYLKYAITLHNPNTDTAIEGPNFRITARSADGAILGNEEQGLSIIYPGQDFVFVSQAFSVSDAPADVNVEMLKPADYNIKKVSTLDKPEFIPLTVLNTSVIEDGFFTKLTGEIKNDNTYDIDSAHLCVVFRDADGNVTAVDSTYVDHVTAGTTTPFELSIYADNITDTYEAFANTWDFF